MRWWLLSLVCVFAGLAGFGCAGDGETRTPADRPDFDRPDLERPVVEGNQHGLEVRTWVIEGRQDDLIAQLIDSYEDRPTPMPDSERQAWRQSGFRVLTVPLDELNLARGGMRLIGPAQQDWFGLHPEWRRMIEGRRVVGGTRAALADGVMRLPAGQLRLLSRCWMIPGDADARLQTELAVVLQSETGGAGAGLTLPGGESGESQDEMTFPELRSSFVMQKDEALVLIPVSPNFDTGRHIDPAIADQADLEAGPPIPALPTIGEAMLTSVEAGGVEPVRIRAIVVLIARLPETYRLLSWDDGVASWN